MTISCTFYLILGVIETAKKKYSKYHVNLSDKGKSDRTYKGIQYDSLLEMRFYKEVVEVGLENGTIIDCQRQAKYELQPKFKHNDKNILAVNYVADYVLTYKDKSVIVWDVKGGLVDPIAKLKKKLFHYKYPEVDYKWIGHCTLDNGWQEYDIIEKGQRERKKAKKKAKNNE